MNYPGFSGLPHIIHVTRAALLITQRKMRSALGGGSPARMKT